VITKISFLACGGKAFIAHTAGFPSVEVTKAHEPSRRGDETYRPAGDKPTSWRSNRRPGLAIARREGALRANPTRPADRNMHTCWGPRCRSTGVDALMFEEDAFLCVAPLSALRRGSGHAIRQPAKKNKLRLASTARRSVWLTAVVSGRCPGACARIRASSPVQGSLLVGRAGLL